MGKNGGILGFVISVTLVSRKEQLQMKVIRFTNSGSNSARRRGQLIVRVLKVLRLNEIGLYASQMAVCTDNCIDPILRRGPWGERKELRQL